MTARTDKANKMLSIVIPAYNVEQYMPQCLESVFSQVRDHSDIEIIVVDDGSTDNTLSVTQNCIPPEHRENTKIIAQENRGLGGARQTGVDCSTGEWLLFLDSDDFLVAGALLGVRQAIVAHPEANVIGFGWDMFPDGHAADRKPGGHHTLSTEPLQWPHQAWSKVFRQDLLALEPAPSMPYEDLAYIPAILRAADVLTVDDTPVTAYRTDRPSSLMSEKAPSKFLDVIAAADHALEICGRILAPARRVGAEEARQFRTQKIVVDGFLDKTTHADSTATRKALARSLRLHFKPSEIDYGTVKRYKGLAGAAVVAATMHGDPFISAMLYQWARKLKTGIPKAAGR